MKTLIAFFSLFVISLSVMCQNRPGNKNKASQQLMQLERDSNTATMQQDKAWLESFFADELITTHPTSGTLKNKKREIADTIDPLQKPDSVSLGEMKVLVAERTAVITGSAMN